MAWHEAPLFLLTRLRRDLVTLKAVLCALCLGILCLSPAAAQPDAPGAQQGLEAATRLFEARDTEAAYRRMLETAILPDFAALPDETRRRGWYLLGVTAMNTQRYREAHASFRQSSALPGAGPIDLVARATMASVVGDDLDAAVALTDLAHRFPQSLSIVSDERLSDVVAATRTSPQGDQVRFDLIQALITARWTPTDPFSDRSDIWLSYVSDLLQRGEPKRAAVAALMIDAPDAVIALNVDNRFAEVIRQDPARFDLAASLERRLTALREASAADPASLKPINAWANLLLRTGRAQGALKLLDRTVQRASPSDGSAGFFRDRQDQLATTLILKARTLSALGRHDEALASLQVAVGLPETLTSNPAPLAQLGYLQLRTGDAAAALATVGRVPVATNSAHVRLMAQMVRVCASSQLGDKAAADQALLALKDHSGAAPQIELAALLCAGDQATAARLLIARLDAPQTRAEALAESQDYLVPVTMTEFDRKQAEARSQLRARPDVQAALAATGKVSLQLILPAWP